MKSFDLTSFFRKKVISALVTVVQHIKNHTGDFFNWFLLCNAPSNDQIRKNFETLLIVTMKPSLNEQTNFDRLTLFCNGIA